MMPRSRMDILTLPTDHLPTTDRDLKSINGCGSYPVSPSYDRAKEVLVSCWHSKLSLSFGMWAQEILWSSDTFLASLSGKPVAIRKVWDLASFVVPIAGKRCTEVTCVVLQFYCHGRNIQKSWTVEHNFNKGSFTLFEGQVPIANGKHKDSVLFHPNWKARYSHRTVKKIPQKTNQPPSPPQKSPTKPPMNSGGLALCLNDTDSSSSALWALASVCSWQEKD